MAKDTKLANKVDKRDTKKKDKKPNIFVRFGRFCKDVVAELKRVSWPSKKELISYTLAVLAFVAVAAVIIGVLDMAFGAGMQLLIK